MFKSTTAVIFTFYCIFCLSFLLSNNNNGTEAATEFNLSNETLDNLQNLNSNVHASNASSNWYDTITQLFIVKRNSSAVFEVLDINQLRVDTCDNLTTRIFTPRRTALDGLVKKAEEAAAKYDWQKDISTVQFKNASAFGDYHVPGEVDPAANRFGETVNFSFSVVHVPVNTYVGDDSVEYDTLRELDWTESLDEAFIAAEELASSNSTEEDLMWQYFGSHKGFVRHYPGSLWRSPPDEVDLYDSRRRLWYNRASTPVKEVLILVDTSGSTEGQTIYLSTLTVEKILETLSEDDFVQVANFSTKQRMEKHKARLGPDCFPDFVQATAFNKQLLMEYVKQLNQPKSSLGQANFEVALTYAFQTFEEFEKSKDKGKGMGAECSRIIILLTDGGVEKPEALIYTHDPDGTKYRIFTFAMGLTPTPLDAVRWLACENNGYFAEINNIGTIDAGIEQYSHRLSRALALAYSPMPKDSLLSSIYRDDWGLGMLTTLIKPVFNATNSPNVSVLGVMAIDIAVDEFDKFIPFRELGPLSYTMVVNHNGFVVKHPLLKVQERWNKEPPSVDLLDIEVVRDDETLKRINEVRSLLLKEEQKQRQIDGVGAVFKNNDYYAYFINHTQVYFTADITSTAYSLAMAHPIHLVNKVLMVRYADDDDRPDESVLRELRDAKYEVTVSKWRYCDGVFSLTNQSLVLDNLADLIGKNVSCNAAMVDNLLWDASIVMSSDLKNLVEVTDVEAVSLTTSGGLTVMYPEGYYYPDEESSFRLASHYSDPATKRAFARRDLYIYTTEYSIDVQSSDINKTISIYRALSDVEDVDVEGPFIFGVLGITLKSSVLADTLLSVQDVNGAPLCNSTDSRCFLLDEGGFIIYESNVDDSYNHAGMWLGKVDRSLMHALYNESEDSIYRRHKFYDYQATCVYDWLAESSSAASRLSSLYGMGEMMLTQAFSALAMLYSSIVTYSSGIGGIIPPLQYGEKYEVCTKISYQYYFNDAVSRADLSVRDIYYSADSCYRSGVAVRVEGTNLLLVVADGPTGSCDGVSTLPHDPVEILNEDYTVKNPSVCERHLRDRRPPIRCLNSDKKVALCQGCERSRVSLAVLSAAIMLYMLLH